MSVSFRQLKLSIQHRDGVARAASESPHPGGSRFGGCRQVRCVISSERCLSDIDLEIVVEGFGPIVGRTGSDEGGVPPRERCETPLLRVGMVGLGDLDEVAAGRAWSRWDSPAPWGPTTPSELQMLARGSSTTVASGAVKLWTFSKFARSMPVSAGSAGPLTCSASWMMWTRP
jgi:hypothetical protein